MEVWTHNIELHYLLGRAQRVLECSPHRRERASSGKIRFMSSVVAQQNESVSHPTAVRARNVKLRITATQPYLSGYVKCSDFGPASEAPGR